MKRRFKNTLIFHLTRVVMILVGRLSASWADRLGRCCGLVAYRLARYERNTAIVQIASALGKPQSHPHVRQLTRGVFIHLGRNSAEICRLLRGDGKPPLVVVDPGEMAILRELLTRGKGLIFVTGHLGNWELMARQLAALGFGITTVAKASYDDRFTHLIDDFRRRGGIDAIYRGDPHGAIKMLRALRAGRILGMLIDQDTQVKSVFVPFFGKPAHTPVSPAVLALRCGVPVVVGTIHRMANGNHRLSVEPCHLPDTIPAATAVLTARLECRIRRHPSQWVWFHRRWKTQPCHEARP